MKYTGKPLQYSLKEHLNISNFISSVYRTTKQLDDFPLARFEIWVYEHYNENTDFFADNCHIWRDDSGEIAGILISEDGENGFHLISHPQNTGIFEIMISFLFDSRAKDRNELWTELSAFKRKEHEIYAEYGIVKTESYALTRYYDLKNFSLMAEIPEDYYIESADMNLNPAKHVELVKNAFGKDFYSEKLYEKLRNSPNYHADLDITVYSKTGKAVSACTGWVDPVNRTAEIETVCTHSDYRRKGLARIAMIKCLQKLKEKGVSKAYISSLNDVTHNFYDSFSYKNRQKSYEYSWKRNLGERSPVTP